MLMYVLLCLIPIIVCCLRIRGKSPNSIEKRAITLFFLIFLLMLACRAITIGTDTANYQVIFNRFAAQSFREVLQYKEPAFSILCKIISYFTTDYQVFIIVTAFFSLLPIMLLYRDQIKYPILTIALFLTASTFLIMFSAIRQSIAISVGVIAFYFVKKKKIIPFVLMVFLAILFHRSAFILAFMYPLYHIKFGKKSLYYLIPILLLIFIFNEQIFYILRLLLKDYENVIDVYTGSITMLILFIMFLIFSFVVVKDEELDADTRGMRNFLLIITVIQMFAPLNTLAMRFGYYYMVFLPIIIPKLIAKRTYRLRHIATLAHIVMVVFFLLRFFLVVYEENTLNTFPYRFFWEV